MTTALVIGAGVAGPVAAMALQRAGIRTIIYEQHPAGADEVGSWLTLQANGIDALRAVDADRVVADVGFPTSMMRFVNGSGRVLGTMSNGTSGLDGTKSLLVRRADLYRGLRDEAVARGAAIRYGSRLVGASTGPRVTASFADGSTAEGDLLIGCDGISSRVRQLIDPSAGAARYVPVLNIGGYVPRFRVHTPPEEFRMMFGKRCFFGYSATPDGGVVWFANPPRRDEPAPGELAAMTDAQWRGWLLDLLADDEGPGQEIVAAAPGPLRGWATYDMPTVRRWHRDRAIVIGDAAHATAPSAGQGAAMALEDAVILAQCLRDVPDIPAAYAAFERLRRARVERVVAHGARSSNAKAAGPIGRIIRDAVLPVLFRRAARDGGASLNWMHGHHIDWDTPVAAPGSAALA